MIINSKQQLMFFLMADRMMNRGNFNRTIKDAIKELFLPDYTMRYLECMRKANYYSHLEGKRKIIGSYYKLKQRKLGVKLGYSIANDVFGYGLVIPHYGTIVVGGGNQIGNYAVLHTSTCITNGQKQIGDYLYVSTGAKLTTMETLGDGITVAANSVVAKSIAESNVLLAGMPAGVKKYSVPWVDKSTHADRVKKIEELKLKMKI